jgi:replicative DNA helicase
MTTVTLPAQEARHAPHAIEAEEAVLGCILINPQAYNEVAWFLRPDDFFLHRHRWIYAAFGELTEAQLATDILTVSDRLEKKGLLDEAGGVPYLTRLITSVPTSLHAEAYGRLVEREAIRRALLEAATQVARLAFEESRDIGEAVAEANRIVAAVYRERAGASMSLGDAAQVVLRRIRDMKEHPERYRGVTTGLLDLDALLGGLMPGDLMLLAGRPGTGKTALMVQIAKHNAAPCDARGEPKVPLNVALFSLEMGSDQLAARALSGDAAVDMRRLRLAQVDEQEWPRIVQAAEGYAPYRLFLDDTAALTPSKLRAKCRRMEDALGEPLGLVVADYLQLMAGDGKIENRTQEIGQISRGLKQLARDLRCPVLAGAQLNRAVEHRADRKPVLADLREGGSQENDADIVALMSPAEQPNLVNLDVAKFRNGQTGTVALFFNKRHVRFENAAVGTVNL